MKLMWDVRARPGDLTGGTCARSAPRPTRPADQSSDLSLFLASIRFLPSLSLASRFFGTRLRRLTVANS